jgi:hypothetical protein
MNHFCLCKPKKFTLRNYFFAYISKLEKLYGVQIRVGQSRVPEPEPNRGHFWAKNRNRGSEPTGSTVLPFTLKGKFFVKFYICGAIFW